jgi:hypothetical protein
MATTSVFQNMLNQVLSKVGRGTPTKVEPVVEPPVRGRVPRTDSAWMKMRNTKGGQ